MIAFGVGFVCLCFGVYAGCFTMRMLWYLSLMFMMFDVNSVVLLVFMSGNHFAFI